MTVDWPSWLWTDPDSRFASDLSTYYRTHHLCVRCVWSSAPWSRRPAQGTYGRSFPPVTISPSLRVVYMVKTGPLWALATTRTRKCSLQTYTSPLTAPVKVRLFWRRNGTHCWVYVWAALRVEPMAALWPITMQKCVWGSGAISVIIEGTIIYSHIWG